MRAVWVLAAVACFAADAEAKVDVDVGGQVRPRFEFRDPVGPGYDTFTSMRARINVGAKLDRKVRVFLQMQDVRLWGEETSTLGDFRADNLDLHQGYIQFGDVGDTSIDVRIGRQEISLGGQRLIGAVGWTQQGRAFDAVRVSDTPGRNRYDVVFARLGDATASTIGANAYLATAYVTASINKHAGIDLYGMYNRASGGVDTDQFTVGARLVGKGRLTYRVEAAFQTGDRTGDEVTAYMLGGRVGHRVSKKATLTLWFDYLSGDDDLTDNKTKVFDTLFATNHKFYGFADLFLNIPVHTAGHGLMDAAAKLALAPSKRVKLGIDLHAFRAAEKRVLSSARLAEELDVTLTYSYSKQASIVLGGSYVAVHDGLKTIGRASDNVAWAYAMTNVQF